MGTKKLQIDGVTIEAPAGQTVLQASQAAGIYIPTLCSHPDLTPQGGCKLCVVEIDGSDGPMTSCTTEVESGMVVRTKSDRLSKIRNMTMELILASHPADCTSCPVYLNCELQAMIQYVGATHSRLRTIRKKNTHITLENPLIVRDMDRCIQCGRCVRACSELRDVGILSYNKREGETYISTTEDASYLEASCRFCSACVEVCPTGALRDLEGIFSKSSPRELALVPCADECPAHIDVPGYVRYVGQGRYSEAVGLIREKVPFPLVLGYVCNRACETRCRREKLNAPISIRNLKRHAVENDTAFTWKERAMSTLPSTGKRVAVVGAGPAGLTSAYYLAKRGHAVTVYDRQPVSGGMLVAGVPAYRLPRDAVAQEVAFIAGLGIDIVTNTEITSVAALQEQGFDAVVIAVGNHMGRKLPIAGATLPGVITAIEFLRTANLGHEMRLGTKLVVLGGGNVSFDCARTARRLGAQDVHIMCLESRSAMLADREEIEQGEGEGITIHNGKTFLSLEGDDNGVTGVRYQDISGFSFNDGRLSVDVVPDSEAVIEADMVIFAAGQRSHLDESFGVELTTGNLVKVDAETLETKVSGVFATGDIVYGTRFVIKAIESGRQVAQSVDRYLGGTGEIDEVLVDREPADAKIGKVEGFVQAERQEPELLAAGERLAGFPVVECGLGKDAAVKEAKRCLQCDLRVDISPVKFWSDYTKK